MRGRAGGGSWVGAVAAAAAAVVTSGGCDVRPQRPMDCPPCECKCNCEPAATQPALATEPAVVKAPVQPVQPVQPMTADVGELVTAATRKLMHDDGAGCLADLDRVAAIDPKLDVRLAATRGQCEMLIGQCQVGKERIARWYETDAGMQPERAMITAEQIGSMRCREGDSSERDRLLRAYFDLSDGAYMNKRSSEFCKTALATARELIPRVKPRAPDDGQITGGAQALFHTAASCFARAGDCKQAWATYSALFPQTTTTPEAAAMMPGIIREAYDTSILFCGAKQREAPIPQSPPQRR